MKKYSIIAVVFVLTALIFTGCRGRNDNQEETSGSATMPTIEMPTIASTEAPTKPSIETMPMPSESMGQDATETVGTDGFVDTNPTENNTRGRNQKIPGMG